MLNSPFRPGGIQPPPGRRRNRQTPLLCLRLAWPGAFAPWRKNAEKKLLLR
ncbi:hypothetical protein SAMN03097705_3692 [[Enterobacter] aerogenes]|nr:hypothetical protein SAMN03097705_3692 [[Enterobacter] aerogenes] [Klebsiella aerogenes]